MRGAARGCLCMRQSEVDGVSYRYRGDGASDAGEAAHAGWVDGITVRLAEATRPLLHRAVRRL